MASKRELKKHITSAAEELMNVALILEQTAPEAEQKNVEAVVNRILEWHDLYRRRVSHPDGKDSPKLVRKYFNELLETSAKALAEIDEEIDRLVTATIA